MGHKESNQTNKHIDGRHFAFGADPAVVPIPGHMASLLFYLSFIGMVLVVIATRHIKLYKLAKYFIIGSCS